MPSIVHDPDRLPTRAEAERLARWMRERARMDPDGDSDDYLVAHLLDAYAQGTLIAAPESEDPVPR